MSRKTKLHILFYAGDNRYAVAATDVMAIVPMAVLQAYPNGPDYLAGALNYHGESIPVVDMTILLKCKKNVPRLSTRILLVNVDDEDERQTIGILAEKVTEAVRIDDTQFMQTGVSDNNVEHHEVEVKYNNGILHHLDVMEILPKTDKELLFEPK